MASERTSRRSAKDKEITQAMLRHWREALPQDRLAHLVRDAARALTRALHARLVQHSVSFGHWAFLRILWEEDGLTQRELSVRAGVMEPTTFAALKTMERLGYIRRMQAPDNRKNIYIFLTPKGRQLQVKLVPLAEQVNEIAVRGLSRSDIAATRRALLAIIENLAAAEANGNGKRLPSTRQVARLLADAS